MLCQGSLLNICWSRGEVVLMLDKEIKALGFSKLSTKKGYILLKHPADIFL